MNHHEIFHNFIIKELYTTRNTYRTINNNIPIKSAHNIHDKNLLLQPTFKQYS